MGKKVWVSGAPAVAQVTTLTVGGTPQLPAPAAPTVSNSGTGGTVPAGTYQVEITYVNAAGETTASASASTTTTGTTSTLTINSPPAQGSGTGAATGWYAYVTQAGGSTYYRQQAAGSPTAIGTNLTLTANPSTTGANPPASNTAAGMVYSVSMGLNNTKTVSYTSTASDTNTSVATSLQANLSASTFPEFEEETWANPSAGVVTATAGTAGVPFALTAAATGTGTLTASTTTAGSGPNDVSIASNWSTNALPAAGDDVYITGTSQGLLYNLQALLGVAVNSITWDTTFTGNAALPSQNPNGYAEYRQQYFQISATTENYLPGTGSGSQLIQRDNGSAQWTVNVSATGSPLIQGRPALLLKGTNAANVLNATQGSLGSAIDPGDAATWQAVNIGYQKSQGTDVSLTLGAGCTLTTINQDGGQLAVNSAVTTLTQRGGQSAVYGTGAVGTLDVEAGACSYQSSGTITTATVGVAGTLDFRQDPRAKTVTNCTVYGTLLDPFHVVTFTNPVSFPDGVGPNGATLDYGANFHLARS